MTRALMLSPLLTLLIGCDLDLPETGDGATAPDTEPSEETDAPAAAEEESADTGAPVEEEEPEEEQQEEEEPAVELSMVVEGPGSITAGEQADFTAQVTGSDGLDYSDEVAFSLQVTGPEGEVSVDGLSFSPLIAGDYDVTVVAAWEEVSLEGEAALVVAVGAPIAISLDLGTDDADPGDVLTAEVSAWDIGGNAVTDAAVALRVSPADGISVDGMELTVLLDGDYAVTAEVQDLSAAAVLFVDGNGPLITIDDPTRASFVDAGATTVTGSVVDTASAVDAATLQEETLTLDSDGSFSAELTFDVGVNTLRIATSDADGNESDAVAAVIAGDFLGEDEPFEGFRLRTGSEALSSLTGDMELPLDDVETSVMDANPLVEEYTSECNGYIIEATAVTFGATDITLEPAEGALEVVATISDLQIDVWAEGSATVDVEYYGEVCFTEESTDAITVAEIILSVDVGLSAEDGGVVASVADSSASFVGVDEGSAGEYGVDIEAMLEALLLPMVEDAVPGAVQAAFSEAQLDESFTISGATIDLSAEVSDVEVDAGGVELVMETLTSGTAADDAPAAPGSLVLLPAAPDLGEDTSMGLSVDTLNRLLHLSWQAGAMNSTISNDELGLDPSIIGLLFDGATTLSLDLSAQLPPVVLDEGADQPLSLGLGELRMEAWGAVDGTEQLLGTISLHLSGDLTPEIKNGSLVLVVDIADMESDVIDIDATEVGAAEDLEMVLSLVSDGLGADLLSDVTLALPDTLGEPADATMNGEGWLLVSYE